MMKIAWIIKILDVVHDVLCPFFRNKEKKKDTEKK